MNIGQKARELQTKYQVDPRDSIKVYGLAQDMLYGIAIRNNARNIINDTKINNQACEITGRYFRMQNYLVNK